MKWRMTSGNAELRALVLGLTLLFASDLVIAESVAGSPDGQPHADAPAELQQFHFMIGEFSRRERVRSQDGTWGDWEDGEWNARYFMNGFGIIDETRNYETGVVTANTRIYDAEEGRWKVIWMRLPRYTTLLAEGGEKGDGVELVDIESGNRWVFSDITDNSYVWTLYIQLQGQYVPVREIQARRKL